MTGSVFVLGFFQDFGRLRRAQRADMPGRGGGMRHARSHASARKDDRIAPRHRRPARPLYRQGHYCAANGLAVDPKFSAAHVCAAWAASANNTWSAVDGVGSTSASTASARHTPTAPRQRARRSGEVGWAAGILAFGRKRPVSAAARIMKSLAPQANEDIGVRKEPGVI